MSVTNLLKIPENNDKSQEKKYIYLQYAIISERTFIVLEDSAMYYRFLMTISLLLVYAGLAAQGWTVKGVVLDKKSGKPVEYATVVLSSTEQWALADAQGKFVIKNVT